MARTSIWRKGRRRWLFVFVFFLSTVTSHSQHSNHINSDELDNDEDIHSTTTPETIFEKMVTFEATTTSTLTTTFKPHRKSKTQSTSSSPLHNQQSTTRASSSTTESTTLLYAVDNNYDELGSGNASSSGDHFTLNNVIVEESYHFNFSHPSYNATIPENSVQKTYVVQPYSDKARMGIQLPDDGLHNIDVKYQIIGGDKNKVFKADERVVGDFAFLTIRTRTNNIVLNREKGDSYRLRVRATVSRTRKGAKKKIIEEAETFIDVKVLDKNDLSPLFYPTKYSISITDDTPLHQSILRVTAEDADIGINGGEIESRLYFLN